MSKRAAGNRTAAAVAQFVPIQLLGQTKSEGFVVKLRQIGHGTCAASQFAIYNLSGPALAARQLCSNNSGSGSSGYPWMCNFKV